MSMTVKEAEEILDNPELTCDNRMLRNEPFKAQGFLECHELYKPLVEALEKMNRGHWGEAPELTNQALLYFRTKILGEL